MRTSQRLAVALLAATLLSTACGARLSDDQLSQALSQPRTAGAAGTALLDDAGDEDLPLEEGADPAADEAAVVAGDAGSGPAAGAEAGPADAGTTGGGGGGGGGGGEAGTTGGGGPAGGGDTRAAPPGGNGGATDTGITADKIVVSNIADISGAVPGLFEDAQQAVKAYVAMFSATEGTIYGRRLELLPLDGRLDAGANRAAAIQACNDSFASVGSTTAFDQGGAPVIQQCGIPDIRGIATTDQAKAVSNSWPVLPAGVGGERSLGLYAWVKDKHPEAIKNAGYLYSDGEVTRQTAQQDIKAAETALGYQFTYQAGVGTSETNYAPFVQQLKSKGITYVTFVGAYQQAASLARTMQQQNYAPTVFHPTVTAYTPEFLKVGGASVEGTYISVGPSLVEEIAGNRELQTYAKWLEQVAPGARPTALGQYAWAAAALFVERAKLLGPELTRAKLNADIPKVTAYTGNGLFTKANVGQKKLSDCTQVVQVKGGKFVRYEPAAPGRHRCNDGIFDTKTNKIISRG